MVFRTRNTHLPPGPSGLPVLGNVFDIPHQKQWEWFYGQSKKYGSDVNLYTVFGTKIIVLNSREAIEALFEKELERYSSKAPRKMADISNLTMTLPFMDPGDVFSHARKQFHLGIGPTAVGQYAGACEAASAAFVRALAADEGCTKLTQTIDHSLGALFLRVSTGYDGARTGEALDKMNALAHFAADVLADKYRCFDIPPLNKVVSWVPGWVPWLGKQVKLGREWKTQLHATAAMTVDLTKEGTAAGHPSVMAQEGIDAPGADEQSKMIAATMNAGGMLASESATVTFLLAMAQHPEIMRRAQAEVDGVCAGRLPTLTDRKQLPFLDAVFCEVLRWVSIAPVISREVMEDDHYNGHLIPKGAQIMANSWAISRDESEYPEPEKFLPDRFLDATGTALRTDILHPMKYAFGYGHRTCPGRFLADALLFSHFAHILAVFDVQLPLKTQGAKLDADGAIKLKSNGAAVRIEEVYVTLSPRATTVAAAALAPKDAPAQNGHANGVAH
ncbi:cytochrome P450 [Epithele typhae]|uniref:cytochrome P450 n=1 Tax=Epithele typhae TaxID=378194 RepID=UPI0020081EFC|nr:cytochrome P450 [Epithele typhae]KAH9915928.1 cytochrome P450 [Epithele typhae]